MYTPSNKSGFHENKCLYGGTCDHNTCAKAMAHSPHPSRDWEEEFEPLFNSYFPPLIGGEYLPQKQGIKRYIHSLLSHQKEQLASDIQKRQLDVLKNSVSWNEKGRREGNWELGYDDAVTDALSLLRSPEKKV